MRLRHTKQNNGGDRGMFVYMYLCVRFGIYAEARTNSERLNADSLNDGIKAFNLFMVVIIA